MSNNYPSLGEAARALLVHTCSVLNKKGVEYVIAGGWVPVLRGWSDTTLHHPGTRNVDVLFNDDRETIRNAVQLLLGSGFVLSAKHEFQLAQRLELRYSVQLRDISGAGTSLTFRESDTPVAALRYNFGTFGEREFR